MDPELAESPAEFEAFQAIFEPEHSDITEAYSKADLTTTESDSQWADAS